MTSSGPEPTSVDLDRVADRHNVRVSVEDGFGMPVMAGRGAP